jgi:phosphoserine phosphatase
MKIINTVKKHTSKVALVSGSTLASASALANDNPITSAINSAVSAGQSNYSLVVVGVIALAALGFGLSAITGAMRK